MKFKDILVTANSNLLRNKVRTALTIIAIFIGTFTIALSVGVNIGVSTYFDQFLGNLGSKTALTITRSVDSGAKSSDSGSKKYDPDAKADPTAFSKKDLEKIKAHKYIETANFQRLISAEYLTGANGEKLDVVLKNMTPGFEPAMRSGAPVDDNAPEPQVMLTPDYVASLGYDSARDIVGKTVKIGASSRATDTVTEVDATVTGIRVKNPMRGNDNMVNKALADKIAVINEDGVPAAMRGRPFMVAAEMKSGLTTGQIEELKKNFKADGMDATTLEDQSAEIHTMIDSATAVLIIFGLIALLAAVFGIINTLYMGVQERTREIGLMKAMGMARGKIFSLFSMEAIMIGFWGSALGIVGAMICGLVINPFAAKTFLSNAEGFKLIGFNLPSVLVILLVIMFIAFLAGVLPSRKASKQDPISALRYE
jgi:putative ABC transport system permease protein